MMGIDRVITFSALSTVIRYRPFALQIFVWNAKLSLVNARVMNGLFKNSMEMMGTHQPLSRVACFISTKKKHTTQFYSDSGKGYRKQHTILSISTSSLVDDCFTNTYIPELKIECSKNSESNSKELEHTGRTLHPFLVPPIHVATKSHQTFANP